MPDVVLLDAGPLGMAAHPRPVPQKSRLLEPIVCIIMEKLSPYGGSLPSSR
jgi:hypothetical protein